MSRRFWENPRWLDINTKYEAWYDRKQVNLRHEVKFRSVLTILDILNGDL